MPVKNARCRTVTVGRALALLLTGLLLTACATPAERLEQQAMKLGFRRQVLAGDPFVHIAYWKPGVGEWLHVYLDGDGTPWQTPAQVADDPTPRRPLVLELLAQDPAPGLYLGRPCYHGLASLPPCEARLWTSLRYSPPVVDSLAAVLASVLADGHYRGLVLIGYSGGRTLAWLLAERLPQTQALLTIAANLDPDRWSDWHGWSRLDGSLNPATRPPLPPTLVQLHVVGADDTRVPPFLTRAVAARQPEATVIEWPGFNHDCCWQQVWPELLQHLQTALH
jgi:pimeloyl-ACP methyl ester carboxylesterase